MKHLLRKMRCWLLIVERYHFKILHVAKYRIPKRPLTKWQQM